MLLADIRRQNALLIMRENALDEISFALCLGKDEVQIMDMLTTSGKKKIGDALARLMEQTFSKPNLWLDQLAAEDDSAGPSYDLFG